MFNKIGLWILGAAVGMVFVEGQHLAAALGVIATLFFMSNHFEGDEETIYLDEGVIESERKNDVS